MSRLEERGSAASMGALAPGFGSRTVWIDGVPVTRRV